MSIQLFIDKWLSRFEQSHFEWLLTFTVLVTLTWIVLAIFMYWRRAVTNLTPVDVPAANRDATPDFLQVDKQKQKEALQRGDAYAAQLENPTRQLQKVSMLKTVCGYFALTLAGCALAVFAFGSIWPESLVGGWLK